MSYRRIPIRIVDRGIRRYRSLLGARSSVAVRVTVEPCHDVPMRAIDLNSDAAESFGSWTMGDDAGILESITSINIACGFHGGDARTMRRVTALAAARGVVVGAHVGYRDLPGFGRRFIAYDYEDLAAETLYQLGALAGIARAEGTTVRYVKPHGALAHAIVHDDGQARAVVDAVAAFDPEVTLLLLPGSRAAEHAHSLGLRVVQEAFADRAYRPDGSLVPRTQEGAVLHDTDRIIDNVLRFVADGTVTAPDGSPIPLEAGSLCVHGDTPGAVALAAAIRSALDAAGAEVRSFLP